MTRIYLIISMVLAGLCVCASFFVAVVAVTPKSAVAKTISVPVQRVEIVNRYPHDTTAFSQGLVFSDGVLLEGTGLYNQSQLREVDIKTGKVLKKVSLHPKLFGEGITLVGNLVYQLTWQKGIAIVYDRKTFREKKRFRYRGEGWGLAYDGKQLIMSNGSDLLQFRDPTTFRVTKTLRVRYNSRPLTQLNELEYVNGEIYANIWHSEFIARIDPKTGTVVGLIDISGLNPSPKALRKDNVANGIAYDADKKRLFITGKKWSILYEVRIK